MPHQQHLSDEQLLAELQRRMTSAPRTAEQARLQHDLEEMGAKLREAEQVKSYFLSSIRNELNNPLSSILGLSKTIASGSSMDPERLKAMASLIHQEAFNLDLQIRNIIAAAEIESGAVPPDIVTIDPAAIAESVRDLFAARIAHRRANVILEHADPHLRMNSDPYMVHMILSNLLANALEHGHAEGGVIIRTAPGADGGFVLSVKDHGLGIAEEEQKQLFRRFHQLDRGRSKQHGGHGLGLAIVNEFTEALGGTLEVRSAKGLGAEFIVSLPTFSIDHVVKGVAMESNTVLFGDAELF
jgi:signal transduction histidine kinase